MPLTTRAGIRVPALLTGLNAKYLQEQALNQQMYLSGDESWIENRFNQWWKDGPGSLFGINTGIVGAITDFQQTAQEFADDKKKATDPFEAQANTLLSSFEATGLAEDLQKNGGNITKVLQGK